MPFDSTTLGSAAFLPPSVSADVRVPLSVSLGPGWYGLIFSITGPGAATMPNNNTDLPGATYFFWTGVPVPCPVCPPMPFQWRDSGSQTGERFVVEGNFAPTSVPEPKAAALMGAGLLIGLFGFFTRSHANARITGCHALHSPTCCR